MKKKIVNLLRIMGLLNTSKMILRCVNFMTIISLNKKTIRTPYLFGIHCKVNEPWMIEVLKKIFNLKHGAFIDVGVNIGQTLIQVKAIEGNRKYIGFEPNPSCNFYVEQLIQKNKFTDCLIIPAGLFVNDSLMKLDLYGDDITNSGASLITDFRESRKNDWIRRSIIVPVYSFNTVKEALNINAFDIVKIDVEGSELEVLNALKSGIIENNPIILLEVLPAYSPDNSKRIERQNKIMQLMIELNYAIYRIVKNRNNKFEGILKIEDFGIHSNLEWCDYLLIPDNELAILETNFSIIV